MAKTKIIYFTVLISIMGLLFYSCGENVTASWNNERIVARFSKPANSVVDKFNSSHYDVVGYEPHHYLDILVTRSEYDDLIIEGYVVEIMNTEESIIKEIIKQSEAS